MNDEPTIEHHGLIQPMKPWTPDELRQRKASLQIRGMGGKYYEVKEVDRLLAQVLGALQGFEERVERAEMARDRALDDLHRFTEENPDAAIAPLQAQAMIMKTQDSCDSMVAATEEYCRVLVEDARAEAESQTKAEEESVGVKVGELEEPRPTNDAAADAEATLEWIDAAEDYLFERRRQVLRVIDENIERFTSARERANARLTKSSVASDSS